jgi:hypothetical protein
MLRDKRHLERETHKQTRDMLSLEKVRLILNCKALLHAARLLGDYP